jgi:hypothetical protein
VGPSIRGSTRVALGRAPVPRSFRRWTGAPPAVALAARAATVRPRVAGCSRSNGVARLGSTEVDEEGERLFPFYEGALAKDCRSGRGVYTFANGDKYSGEFKVRVCGQAGPSHARPRRAAREERALMWCEGRWWWW